MGIANFPFPSFTFVLTSDRVVIPGPSYVIRLAPLVVLHPHTPQTTVLTTNLANEDVVDDNYLLANLNLEYDSLPDVAFGRSDAEELVYDGTEIMSTSTRTVQTAKEQDAVGNKLLLLKMRRFRFKSIFKHLHKNGHLLGDSNYINRRRPWIVLGIHGKNSGRRL